MQVKRIAVIGGGISGLSAACYLHHERSLLSSSEQESVEFCLFEAGTRLGGVIETLSVDQLPSEARPSLQSGVPIVEKGADNFATLMPDALELSRLVGADEMLIRPNQKSRLARVVARGEIYPIPEGFSLMQPTQLLPILRSPILSLAGKVRVLGEYFVSQHVSDDDESLKSFATRRLGREAFDRLVEPIIGGIFTADAGLLSMKAAMPQFIEMERKFGGLIKAARSSAISSATRFASSGSLESTSEKQLRQSSRKATGARYDQFMAPRDGMNAWLRKIASWLPVGIAHLNMNIDRMVLDQDRRWCLLPSPEGSRSLSQAIYPFDGVIIASPSKAAAKLLRDVDRELSESLAEIQYADSAVVCLCVERSEISPEHHCFGIVVPRIEGRDCLAISLTSEKYPGRIASDKVLLRVFMGGAVRPDLMLKSDEELSELAWREVQSLLHLKTKPNWKHVVRWPSAMPQYHVGHLDRLEALESRVNALPNLALAGNAYRGVGIPQCVRSGKLAAQKILSSLIGKSRP